jgi:hypothetical protein
LRKAGERRKINLSPGPAQIYFCKPAKGSDWAQIDEFIIEKEEFLNLGLSPGH